MARVVLITGGTTGIGAKTAMMFKENGYQVVCNYIGNKEKAQSFSAKTGIAVYEWDVTDPDACEAEFKKVSGDFGPVSVLVNNAGIIKDHTITKMTIEEWQSVLNVDLNACFYMARQAVPAMKEQKFGRIISLSSVNGLAGQLGYVLERKEEPKVSIGARCFAPFECDYRPYCWAHVPDYSVYDVFQKPKAEEIAKLYGLSLEKLPRDVWPSGNKALDLESYLSGQALVDAENIRAFLGELQYPLYFLDYETLMPAIPLFEGTRPFQQIPFQYSVHVQQAPSSPLDHKGFLHQDQSDPRKAFVEKLIQDCGTHGTIIVYNQAFEIARNNELAADFPEYAESINAINDRVIDLLVPFRSRWLYHPNQKGSASIKAVLPAFTDLSYDDLEISHGGEAMRQYGAFMSGNLDASFWDALWGDLSAYCKQDTFAMVELLNVLMIKTKTSADHFAE